MKLEKSLGTVAVTEDTESILGWKENFIKRTFTLTMRAAAM
jgi:hypothetical protein